MPSARLKDQYEKLEFLRLHGTSEELASKKRTLTALSEMLGIKKNTFHEYCKMGADLHLPQHFDEKLSKLFGFDVLEVDWRNVSAADFKTYYQERHGEGNSTIAETIVKNIKAEENLETGDIVARNKAGSAKVKVQNIEAKNVQLGSIGSFSNDKYKPD